MNTAHVISKDYGLTSAVTVYMKIADEVLPHETIPSYFCLK